ncbi:Uncharacterized protein Adt_42812 [Abeliophyllum distichum]|uniref:Uncharacterized protein n=1 Tax=Abeliophyllum distichum TaxID=126358 RepID=A0ABD1PWQ1_9LAMI
MGEGRKEEVVKISTNALAAQIYAIREEEPETMPAEVSNIVNQFPDVFSEPKGLPPPSTHDHHIPLKEGAQPFKIEPYMSYCVENKGGENGLRNDGEWYHPSNSKQ